MDYLLPVILALAIFALILFPEFRGKLKVLLGGFLNVFVEDQAKTPEGAKAIFTQAIEAKQEKYNNASTTYNRVAGELAHAERNLVRLERQLTQCEASCESLVKAGRMQEAQVFADQRTDLLSDIETEKQRIAKLKPMVAQAKEICETYGRELKDLQRKMKETVNKIRMNSQMKDLYADLDDLRKDSPTDKMMDAVISSSSELEKEASGAKIVHESRTSTKVTRAKQSATQIQTEEYLKSLTQKYNGGK